MSAPGSESHRANDSEEPVREKLEETSISPAHTTAPVIAATPPVDDTPKADNDEHEAESDRANGHTMGPSSKKRGLDEDTEAKPAEKHFRKVSRDLAIDGAEEPGQDDVMGEDGGPGKKKRESTEHGNQDEPVPAQLEGANDVNGAMLSASTPPPAESIIDEKNKESLSSPTNKRRHEQMARDHEHGLDDAVRRSDAPSPPPSASMTQLERAAKRQKSQSPDLNDTAGASTEETARPEGKASKIPNSSGFANTSSVSGFAALAKSTSPPPTTIDPSNKGGSVPPTSGFANSSVASPFSALSGGNLAPGKPQTSVSAFASSGFGGFASSSTSPFGAMGKPVASSSLFGVLGSSSGFGSLAPKDDTKSSIFAGGSGSKIVGLSEKPAKPFGAADDDGDEEGEEDDDEDDDDERSESASKSDEPKIKMTAAAHLETGEENEITIYTCRAKLYAFVNENGKKEWKERGLGALRVNVPAEDEPEVQQNKRARILMRADGSHRLMLNSPIQKGTVSGEKPKGMNMLFLGMLPGDAELQTLQLKMKSQFLGELWDHIAELQKLT